MKFGKGLACMISALAGCVLASVAAYAVEAAPVEGRWKSAKTDLVLDITRCGERFCGRLVKTDNQCDRTVLTAVVDTSASKDKLLVLAGKLDLPEQSGALTAAITVRYGLRETADVMTISGWGEDRSLLSRTMPFQVLMSRAGEAQCRVPATS